MGQDRRPACADRPPLWRDDLAIKPTKPNENEAFYREVDEELRKEQIGHVWRRYGWAIIAAVLLLLAATAGYLWWQNHRRELAAEQGEMLLEAQEMLERGDRQAAAAQLARLADSDIEGYDVAASFTRANAAVEAGDEAAAVALLKEIAADENLAEPFRHAALIRQTALEFDRLQPQAVIQRLAPLARPGQPWFGSAGEMVAIAHLKMRRPDRAGPIFGALARDESVPASIRSRAVQMAGALGLDAVQDTAATGAAPAAGAGSVAETKEETE